MDTPDRSSSPDTLSTDVINIAHIRVAGVGGLGLVAMAAIVAWNVPAIGAAVAVALATGIVLAVVIIAWRRRAH
jgi:hypothetical protein